MPQSPHFAAITHEPQSIVVDAMRLGSHAKAKKDSILDCNIRTWSELHGLLYLLAHPGVIVRAEGEQLALGGRIRLYLKARLLLEPTDPELCPADRWVKE